jgi:hypothetical protein
MNCDFEVLVVSDEYAPMIDPEVHAFMTKRIAAKTVSVISHASAVSRPAEIAQPINEAAESTR